MCLCSVVHEQKYVEDSEKGKKIKQHQKIFIVSGSEREKCVCVCVCVCVVVLLSGTHPLQLTVTLHGATICLHIHSPPHTHMHALLYP